MPHQNSNKVNLQLDHLDSMNNIMSGGIQERMPLSWMKTMSYGMSFVMLRKIKAKKLLVLGIGPNLDNWISTCESAKEIWKLYK